MDYRPWLFFKSTSLQVGTRLAMSVLIHKSLRHFLGDLVTWGLLIFNKSFNNVSVISFYVDEINSIFQILYGHIECVHR